MPTCLCRSQDPDGVVPWGCCWLFLTLSCIECLHTEQHSYKRRQPAYISKKQWFAVLLLPRLGVMCFYPHTHYYRLLSAAVSYFKTNRVHLATAACLSVAPPLPTLSLSLSELRQLCTVQSSRVYCWHTANSLPTFPSHLTLLHAPFCCFLCLQYNALQ